MLLWHFHCQHLFPMPSVDGQHCSSSALEEVHPPFCMGSCCGHGWEGIRQRACLNLRPAATASSCWYRAGSADPIGAGHSKQWFITHAIIVHSFSLKHIFFCSTCLLPSRVQPWVRWSCSVPRRRRMGKKLGMGPFAKRRSWTRLARRNVPGPHPGRFRSTLPPTWILFCLLCPLA